MPKFYFMNDRNLIPFTSIVRLEFESCDSISMYLIDDNYFNLPEDDVKDFLTQYTAWLDSQSTPQL
jgi:hypothetical protein